MPLAPGTRLGPYEILAQIGAGGMGEVYKARDPKLDRLVAIKVLPPLMANPDLLARFEREAKAVATLNHPNILGIYDLGKEGEHAYAVMELLEGESLRDRLRMGLLPAKKALDIATQLAEGLAAAHARGIVHRDIKPENIFLTREGRVKVLDFGLAKQLPGWAGGTESDLNQPTQELGSLGAGTEAGTVMGTVGYMAPEQVKGQPADHRADIFAFGVVVYEMLYGRRAFLGQTPVETLHAILSVDPADAAASKVAILPVLEQLIFRCMEKDPEQRYQSLKDLAYDLQHLSTISPGPGHTPAAKARGARRLWLGVGIAGTLVLGLLGWATNLLHVGAPPQPPAFTRLTHAQGTVESAFFGPDGRTIYFTQRLGGGRPAIFVLRPDSPEPKPVEVPDALLLGVSASSELLILRNPTPRFAGHYRGMLAQVNGGGGAVKEIQEDVQEAAWDGQGLAMVTSDAQMRIRLEFANKVIVDSQAASRLVLLPRVSRDGQTLAVVDADTVAKTELVLYDRQGHRKVVLTKTDDNRGDTISGLAWGPGGELWCSEIMGDQTAVWAVARGGHRRLLWRGEGTKALMDVSAEGRMLLAHHQVRRGVLLQKAGEGGARDISIASGTQATGISADGRQVLLQESPLMDGGTDQDVSYLQVLDGSPAIRVTKGTAQTLSTDGAWINIALVGEAQSLDPALAGALQRAHLEPKAVLDPRNPTPALVFVPNGAGRPFAMALPGELTGAGYAYLHPDGRQVLFSGVRGQETFYFSADRQGGAVRAITPAGYGTMPINLVPLSPDGTRIILMKGGQGFTQPLASPEPRLIPGLVKGENPVGWSQDQKAVFVRTMAGLPLVITRVDLASGARQEVLSFTPGDVSGLLFFRSVRMTPDARTFALSYVRKLSDLFLVEGLR